MKRILYFWMLLTLVAAAMPALADGAPFASANEPHAVVYLNGSPRAQDLYPVRVRSINGRLTVRENLPVLRLAPGTYKLQIRLETIKHMENLPGMVAGGTRHRTNDTLTLTVEPGMAYYLAARVQQNGNWQPVIWKTTRQG